MDSLKKTFNGVMHKLMDPYKVQAREIKDNPPKVLLATYVAEHKDYCFDEWFERVKKLTYHNYDLLIVDNSKTKKYYNEKLSGLFGAMTSASIVDQKLRFSGLRIHTHHTARQKNTKQTQKVSQEYIWDFSLTRGYDYVFILESDVFPPLNVIEELMKHRKDVVGGLFSLRNEDMVEKHRLALGKKAKGVPEEDLGNFACVISKQLEINNQGQWANKMMHMNEITKIKDKMLELPWPDGQGNVLQVHSVGFGCILIKQRVLKLVRPREQSQFPEALKKLSKYYFKYLLPLKRGADFQHNMWGMLEDIFSLEPYSRDCHPDTFFARDCKNRGIKIWLNPWIECEHKRSNWSEVKDQ